MTMTVGYHHNVPFLVYFLLVQYRLRAVMYNVDVDALFQMPGSPNEG